MRVNINDIARKCHVSIATVSRVLNNKGPVKESTRLKVLEVAQQMDFKLNPIARGLSRKRTDTIGVILPELVDEFFMNIIQGLDEVASIYHRYLMISSSHSQRNDVETILEFMSSGRVDGVVLMAPSMEEEVYDTIKRSKRPLVLLNCFMNHDEFVRIGIDNYSSARNMVRHLVEHGYERIGMIKGPDTNVEAQLRYKGFIDELKAHSIPIRNEDIVSGDFTLRSGFHGFMRLMEQTDRVRAIFMANDMMAIGAYKAANQAQIRISQDVAIIGFDNIFSSSVVKPRLTTVHIPVVELGRRAGEYMIKMIDGHIDSKQPYREYLSTGLVIGGSCGCADSEGQRVF